LLPGGGARGHRDAQPGPPATPGAPGPPLLSVRSARAALRGGSAPVGKPPSSAASQAVVGAPDQPSPPGGGQGRAEVVADVLPAEQVMTLATAAARAPSGDNCQPWRFRWDGTCLRIGFLPDRAESYYDVSHAASWVSLGAVFVNLRIAADGLGIRPRIE